MPEELPEGSRAVDIAGGDGLLFVLSEPGSIPTADFHAWYDEDHLPARAALPGVRRADRWRVSDTSPPVWAATYELDLEVLRTPAYRRLRAERDAREQQVLAGLGMLDRRVFRRGTSWATAGAADTEAGPVRLTVALSVEPQHEDELARWYAEEHAPQLLQVPGWRSITQYALLEGAGPRHLAVHELDGPQVFAHPAYRQAMATSWGADLFSRVTQRQRWVLEYRPAPQEGPGGRAHQSTRAGAGSP